MAEFTAALTTQTQTQTRTMNNTCRIEATNWYNMGQDLMFLPSWISQSPESRSTRLSRIYVRFLFEGRLLTNVLRKFTVIVVHESGAEGLCALRRLYD